MREGNQNSGNITQYSTGYLQLANLTAIEDVIAYDHTVGWIPGFTIPR
jgi:hypothetical protein